MKTLKGGRLYRVFGASSKTGRDVEITVEAFDEADAARAANRQGVFVSGCMPDASTGSDWAGSVPSAGVELTLRDRTGLRSSWRSMASARVGLCATSSSTTA